VGAVAAVASHGAFHPVLLGWSVTHDEEARMPQDQAMLLLLLTAFARRNAARGAPPKDQAPTTPSVFNASQSHQEKKMPSEFDFLEKHYYNTEIAEVAGQAAKDRFGDYPGARTSTVIYHIDWDALVDLVVKAVDNYSYGSIFATSAYAYLGEYHGAPQWNIVLTDLHYVNAAIERDQGQPTYTITDYNKGTVIVKAEVIGNNPPMLGDIVHLQAAVGTYVGPVKLKN
jgi:hypothetical protein